MNSKICFLALLLTVITSCSKDDGPVPPNLMIVNGLTDGDKVNCIIDGITMATDIAPLGYSNYIQPSEGSRHIEIVPQAGGGVLHAGNYTMENNKSYSLFLLGTKKDVLVTPMEDNRGTPASGKVRIRFIHANPNIGPIDIFDAGDGRGLTNNLAYGKCSEEWLMDAGNRRLQVRKFGQSTTWYDLGNQVFESKGIYTIIYYGKFGQETKLIRNL